MSDLPTPRAAPTPPPAHPLLQRLVDDHGATWVTPQTLPEWLQSSPGAAVVLLAGDAVRFPEGLDVAVVLPELRRASGTHFHIGVVGVDAEDAVAQRWGAQRRPSLVFLRDGRYATTVSGMHDWGEFLALVQAALIHPTGPAPLAIQSLDAAPSCH